MIPEIPRLLVSEVNDNHLDLDRDGVSFCVDIAASVEIVFIDRWPLGQPFGPKYEVNRFQHGGFTCVVVPNKHGVAGEKQLAVGNASKVFDLYSCDSQSEFLFKRSLIPVGRDRGPESAPSSTGGAGCGRGHRAGVSSARGT